MRKIVLTLAAALLSLAALAQTHQLDINLKKAGAPIPSTLYGIFFEDINYAADGGLYAELIKNRSFCFQGEGKCLSATAPAYSFSIYVLEK